MAEELGQQQETQSVQGVLERRDDAGKGESGEVKLWLESIQLASKEESAWREKRAPETIDIYRDATDRKRKRYNILYSNTEVISQAVYNSRALPDVRARYNEADPVSKLTAMILERGLEYCADDTQHDFDAAMKAAVKDVLLPGRCVDRVRYHPFIEKRNRRIALVPGPNGAMMRADSGAYLDPGDEWKTDDKGDYLEGESYEQIVYEQVYIEHVQWASFRRGPGKVWDEVPWIAFEHFLTRDQLIELNKTIGAKLELDTGVSTNDQDRSPDNGTAPSPNIFKRARVWEIWDKEKRKVIWIAPNYKEAPLRKDDDPYNLAQFFPIPRPVLAVEVPETLVPVEPYRLYKDQAEELDIITRRLTALTRVAKWRGIYAMPEGGTDLTTLQNANDGDLVPSQQAAQVGMSGHPLADAIWIMPVKEVAETIEILSLRQQQVKNNIYEIMGIADILRGGSQSGSDRQTAREAGIKAQWGSIRLQHLQQEIQRYVRDLFRLMAELIAEKYQPQTLQLITGLPVPPEVVEILHSDAMRCFKIDIETDSTIQADLERFQQNATQFVAGTAQFFQAVSPAVQGGVMTAQAATDIFKGFSRMFKLPRQAQEAIEAMQAPPPAQPDQAEQAKQQAEVMRAKADVEKTKQEAENARVEGGVKMAVAQQQGQLAQQKHGMEMQKLSAQHQVDMAKLAATAQANAQRAQQPPAGRA